MSTPAQAYLLASVYNTYGWSGFGYFNIGSLSKYSLSISKAAWHALDHSNGMSFLVKFVRGRAISEYFVMNFL